MKRAGRLEVTTRIGCKCNCVYCPQKLLIDSYYSREKGKEAENIMSLDTFATCIDKLPQETRIDFSGMVEPWLNPDCTQMVLYAHEKGFPIAIYTTLVGMKKENFESIKDIPVEEFVLHIPDDKSNAHIEVTDEYVKLLEQVLSYKQQDGRRLVTAISCHGDIHPDIKSLLPENSTLITELHNRAGNVESEYVESKQNTGEIVCVNCEADIHHNVLLPDGTLLLCCMDYGMKHILGNLLTQTYEEIYNSEESQKIRRGMKVDTDDILCRKCINARNINELYDEYYLYETWTKKLVVADEQHQRETLEYQDWIKKYENQTEELRAEIERITVQYDQRISELKDYQQWVSNLENANKELQSNMECFQNELSESQEVKAAVERELESIKQSPFYKLIRMTKK